MTRLILFLAMLLLSSGAHAEWLQSSSAHFVVYANDSERNIRLLSQQLERYDSAMAVRTGIRNPPPSPSNRVTVYVVRDAEQVRDILGQKTSTVVGFYIARAGGSLAVIPRVSASVGGELDRSMLVLLHEYAHHFLISQGGFPLPRWMSEGGAEFWAQATFGSDGSVGLGRPANLRVIEYQNALNAGLNVVDVQELMDPVAYNQRKDKSFDAFYAKSWALYHYLAFSAERNSQFNRYVALMMQGKKSPEAAVEAFGDLKTLDREVTAYLRSSRMTAYRLPANMLQTGTVEVRKLGAGEAATMSIRVRSARGVNKEQAAELLTEARAIAARFPGDPCVLSALAEAEFDAGNDAETLAAANAALAADQTQVNAYVQKGSALLRMVAKAEDKVAASNAARAVALALNKLEPGHPLALIQYYESFIREQALPPSEALRGLEVAAELAPFDMTLRMNLGRQQLRNKMHDKARTNLTVIAFNPHGGAAAQEAQRLLTQMDADPNWDGGFNRRTVPAPAAAGGG